MKIAAGDYAPMKAFFGWIWENAIPMPASLKAANDPIAALNRTEQLSPAKARLGLGDAIGDVMEWLAGIEPAEVRRIDEELVEAGLPTLSQVRLRFWRRVHATMKRGRVRSECDYHALRNVVDAMPETDATKAWEILANFEKNIAVGANR
jgi:hypothetical protein